MLRHSTSAWSKKKHAMPYSVWLYWIEASPLIVLVSWALDPQTYGNQLQQCLWGRKQEDEWPKVTWSKEQGRVRKDEMKIDLMEVNDTTGPWRYIVARAFLNSFSSSAANSGISSAGSVSSGSPAYEPTVWIRNSEQTTKRTVSLLSCITSKQRNSL